MKLSGKPKTRDVIEWIKTNLGQTLGSKRRIAYQAVGPSLKDINESKSGPGSTPGDTPRILARSVSEGNPDPRLRFGLV